MQRKLLIASLLILLSTLAVPQIAQALSVADFTRSWTWWALKSQRDMAIDEPITNMTTIGAHNAYNSLAEGYTAYIGCGPNQFLDLTELLDVGVRYFELDIYDNPFVGLGVPNIPVVQHGPCGGLTLGIGIHDLPYFIDKINTWLENNPNEVLYLVFENHHNDRAILHSILNLGAIIEGTRYFGFGAKWLEVGDLPEAFLDMSSAELATRTDVQDFVNRFPTRADLLSAGVQVVVNQVSGESPRWQFGQAPNEVNKVDYRRTENFQPLGVEDLLSFELVYDDRLVSGASCMYADDVTRYVHAGVNQIHMDGILSEGFAGACTPGASDGDKLKAVVWSWAEDDPAPLRLRDQAFDDGRDVALQQANDRRWQSVAPQGGQAYAFALRRIERTLVQKGYFDCADPCTNLPPLGSQGNFEWKVSSFQSANWHDYRLIPAAELDEDGDGAPEWIFAGPVNGLQNEILFNTRGGSGPAVWINVQDLDKDGNWQVNAEQQERQVASGQNPFLIEARSDTLAITGGVDREDFITCGDSKCVLFATPPNVATPQDSDSNNEYLVEVTRTDPWGIKRTIFLSVKVVNAYVQLTGSTSLNEGNNSRYDFSAVGFGTGIFRLEQSSCGTGGVLANLAFDTTTGAGSFNCAYADGPVATAVSVGIINESNGIESTVYLAVSVKNLAPQITLSGSATATPGSTQSYPYTVNIPVNDTLLGPTQSCGSAGVVVATSRFDPATKSGTLDCRFDANFTTGITEVSVKFSDEDGSVSLAKLDVKALNQAPVVTLIGLEAVLANSAFRYDFTARDPDPQLLTITPECGTDRTPTGYQFDLASGTGSFFCSFAPGATGTVQVTADDGHGGVSADTITVQVINAPDQDGDGVADDMENLAPGGDGNGDGTPDSQQAHVSSVLNSVDGKRITMAAPAGTSLVGVTATVNPAPGTAPPSADFPLGFLDFTVQGVQPGGSVNVTLYLMSTATFNSYYKYGPTPADRTNHWYKFLFDGTTGAEINGNRIVLHFVDGGRGDHDLTANGVIVDPGAPSVETVTDTTPPVANPTQSPIANAVGWNNGDVTVTWNWTDDTGLDAANCAISGTSSGEGTVQLTATCNDLAGNTGQATYSVKVDKTVPTLAPVVSPNPVAVGAAATVNSGAADALSGIASQSCGALDTSSVGVKSVSCTATDNAGHTASATVNYTVQAAAGVLVGVCGGYEVRQVGSNYTAAGWSGTIKVGTNGNNTLNGTNGADLILGLGGNDKLDGKSGDDLLCGGDGVDLVQGMAGNDLLDGGKGNDVLNGGTGDHDSLIGDEGNDTLLDGDGVINAQGGPGNDLITLALRNGWRDTNGQTQFAERLAAGYGNDTVVLVILDRSPFSVDVTGDERDNPPSPLEGKSDGLGLLGNLKPAPVRLKFEKQLVVSAESEAAISEEAGAEYLTEPVGEDTPAQNQQLFLPLISR